MKKCAGIELVQFIIILQILFVSEVFAYCSASGGCDEYIYGVQIGSINTWNSGCSGYYDYTASQSTVMDIGSSYTLTVYPAIAGEDIPNSSYTGDQSGAWIDWNQNGHFYDAGEMVFYGVWDGAVPFSTTVTPPVDAMEGSTVMRVRLMYTGVIDSCGHTTYGEVEDYSIVVKGAATGIVRGTKFNDLNGNGTQDGVEPGISGIEVYLDINGNGHYDVEEPNSVTLSDPNEGYYEFVNLPEGVYSVAEAEDKCGWTTTSPRMTVLEDITMSNVRDIVFDDSRNLLYICVETGSIDRYDLLNKTFLSPYPVGTTLNSMDTTPDENWLYVTEDLMTGNLGFLHKVNLNTGGVTDLSYDTSGSGEGGSWDINIGSAGKGLMTTDYLGSGSTPLRELDISTDTFSVRTGLPYYPGWTKNSFYISRLFRSADRTKMYLVEGDTSAPYQCIYDCPSDSFSAWREHSNYLGHRPNALSPDGSLVGFQSYNASIRIMSNSFTDLALLGNEDGGIGFDPVKPILYIADDATGEMIAVHTKSWNELYRTNVGTLDDYYYGAYPFDVAGIMSFSSNGKYMAIIQDDGVKILQLEGKTVDVRGGQTVTVDFGNMRYMEGDVDGDRSVDLYDLGLISAGWLGEDVCLDIAPGLGDGYVGMDDLVEIIVNWLSGVN